MKKKRLCLEVGVIEHALRTVGFSMLCLDLLG